MLRRSTNARVPARPRVATAGRRPDPGDLRGWYRLQSARSDSGAMSAGLSPEPALNERSPSHGTGSSLVFKYGLALTSVVAYAVIAQLADALEPIEAIPDAGLWFHYVVGAVFGALVLGPYVGTNHRAMRILSLSVASAVIYYLAVKFVVDGPIGYEAITSFVIAGAGAAVLCGVATVFLAPCAP